MEITNRKVIVVGGTSGMGFGAAQAAQAKGAEVVVVGRSAQRLERTASELGGAKRVQTVVADVTREDDVRHLFEAVGHFDHLVVTAASNFTYPPIRELNIDAARRTIDAKLVAALLLAKYAAVHIDEHGSITFTAGIAAERPMPTAAVVASVNGALFSLAYALAVGLAPVRVNALSPGWVDTPTWDTVFAANKAMMLEQMAQRLPARRIGRPEDIALAAIFLMESEFTTGTVLHVDGGHRLV
jgi:NAD(P)-dependent dehydrogenase (short-subunit alcohol dehydrogenase family)